MDSLDIFTDMTINVDHESPSTTDAYFNASVAPIAIAISDSGASLVFLWLESPFIIPGTLRKLAKPLKVHQGSTSVLAHDTALALFVFKDRRNHTQGLVLTVQAILLKEFRHDLVLLSHTVCHHHGIVFIALPDPSIPYGFRDFNTTSIPKDPNDLPHAVASFDCPRTAGGVYQVELYHHDVFDTLFSLTLDQPFCLANDIDHLKQLCGRGVFSDIDSSAITLQSMHSHQRTTTTMEPPSSVHSLATYS